MANFFKSFTIKTKYGALAATAAPIIIFSGIYLAWGYASRALRKKRPVLPRSISMGILHGGKLALQRLINYQEARADATISDRAVNELKSALKQGYPNFSQLQGTVAKLEMSGKEDEAVAILGNAVEKAQKDMKPHEAYEFEMLLVEMLTYKGDFGKAIQCDCLKHEEISDARRPLFLATLHILLGDPDEEALKCWKEFRRIRKHFLSEPSLQEGKLYKVVANFQEFKKVVKLLKDDIQEARAK